MSASNVPYDAPLGFARSAGLRPAALPHAMTRWNYPTISVLASLLRLAESRSTSVPIAGRIVGTLIQSLQAASATTHCTLALSWFTASGSTDLAQGFRSCVCEPSCGNSGRACTDQTVDHRGFGGRLCRSLDGVCRVQRARGARSLVQRNSAAHRTRN